VIVRKRMNKNICKRESEAHEPDEEDEEVDRHGDGPRD
jgi:hypothetical protein